MNYGDKEYAKIVMNTVHSANCMYLQTFLEKSDYFALLEECAYFVSGVLRQQSVGNILYCISHGVKVFLYRNSMMYQYLKSSGFSVYAIEDSTAESFSTPTSKEEYKSNMNALICEINRRNCILRILCLK